jgi:hypothetical protein
MRECINKFPQGTSPDFLQKAQILVLNELVDSSGSLLWIGNPILIESPGNQVGIETDNFDGQHVRIFGLI